MKKIKVTLNTKPEKVIAAASLSAAGAILFHKKGKSLTKKIVRNYRIIDNILSVTAAKSIAENEKNKNKFKTKLKDLDIQQAEFIDI